jgi:hypothetical protein
VHSLLPTDGITGTLGAAVQCIAEHDFEAANVAEFRKRLLISLGVLLITLPLNYSGQRALREWGILDSVAIGLGDWLKIHIAPEQAAWTVAVIISLAAYGLVLWLIWRHYRRPLLVGATEGKAGALISNLSSSIRLSVGEGNEFFETSSKNLYTTFRTFKLRIQNIDPTKSLSGCRVRLMEISPHEYDGPWILKDGFSLSAGDQEFLPLVRYQEAREFNKNPTYGATFMEVLVAKNAPMPLADKKHIFTIRATALESAYCEIQCQVWVEDGRLRIIKRTPIRRELPPVFYKGLWWYKFLARLPFFNENGKRKLDWLATWEDHVSEISLLEAATLAYELTRDLAAGEHAEILAETESDILCWYCTAMALPTPERPPMVALKGVIPPSRLVERIEPSILNRFEFAFENGELILKERSGRRRIRALTVNAKEAETAIAQISSWGGANAASM